MEVGKKGEWKVFLGLSLVLNNNNKYDMNIRFVLGIDVTCFSCFYKKFSRWVL